MAYTATVTLDQPVSADLKIRPRERITYGVINLSNYDATKVAITGITGLFRTSTPRVILSGCSSLGFPVYWDPVTSSVKAFAAVNGAEPANGTNIGLINFLAIGPV